MIYLYTSVQLAQNRITIMSMHTNVCIASVCNVVLSILLDRLRQIRTKARDKLKTVGQIPPGACEEYNLHNTILCCVAEMLCQ